MPPLGGEKKLYENIEGRFVKGDLCSFKISIPSQTDLNDMMYIRLEYMYNARATLIKGTTFDDPKFMYNMKAGQIYTATQHINFYLLFESTAMTSGDFVFTIWFNDVAGEGKRQPSVPDFAEDWVDPWDTRKVPGAEDPPEKEEDTISLAIEEEETTEETEGTEDGASTGDKAFVKDSTDGKGYGTE